MKTLIFITLKILEIAAVVAAYFLIAFTGYLMGRYIEYFSMDDTSMFGGINFLLGVILYLAIILIVIISSGVYYAFPVWIDKNKEWRDRIYKKINK